MTIDELTDKNLTSKPKSYTDGEKELEQIAKGIEQGNVAIDKLGLAVRRADFLNTFLEGQLRNIEEDLKALAPKTEKEPEKKTPVS